MVWIISGHFLCGFLGWDKWKKLTKRTGTKWILYHNCQTKNNLAKCCHSFNNQSSENNSWIYYWTAFSAQQSCFAQSLTYVISACVWKQPFTPQRSYLFSTVYLSALQCLSSQSREHTCFPQYLLAIPSWCGITSQLLFKRWWLGNCSQKQSINDSVIPVSMGIWHQNFKNYLICVKQQTSNGAEENFWDVNM